jgi:hypothetical protein
MSVSVVVASALLSTTSSCSTKHAGHRRHLFGGLAGTCIYDRSKALAEDIQPKP